MFKINVTFYKNYPNCNTIAHMSRNFFSTFAAIHMGKEFASCSDVISVDVINAETGEVMYYRQSNGDTYEADW